MIFRSLLFVPGDRPERMEKARGSGADALILDLEDAVAFSAKDAARSSTAAFLRRAEVSGGRRPALFVRVNALESGLLAEDLRAVLDSGPDGLVLPKAEGAHSVERLIEQVGEGIPILPIATETPAAVFALGTYRRVGARLAGLTWGAEDLPAAIGAATSREPDGRYTAPYEMVRSLTLFGAHAAGTPAIETVFPDLQDRDGLAAYAARARRDGFVGMMAIHPAQVGVINAAFMPTAAELHRARAVVAAFEASPGAGVLQLDGRMIDAPHLKQARRVLGLAADVSRSRPETE